MEAASFTSNISSPSPGAASLTPSRKSFLAAGHQRRRTLFSNKEGV